MEQHFWERPFLGASITEYLVFAGTILLAWFLKHLAALIITRIIYGFLRRFADNIRYREFRDIMTRSIELFLFIFAAFFAFNRLDHPLFSLQLFRQRIGLETGTDPWSISIGQLLEKAFVIALFLQLTLILIKLLEFISLVWTHRLARNGQQVDSQLIPFLKDALRTLTIILGVFFILAVIFGFKTIAALVAGISFGTILLALSAKETVENLFGSFTIFLDKPFRTGDYVKVDTVEGTVERVGFRSTRIITPDTSLVTLPNKKMIDGITENLSYRSHVRIRFNLQIAFDTPAGVLERVSSRVNAYFSSHPDLREDSLVHFETFGENAFQLNVSYYIRVLPMKKLAAQRESVNLRIVEIVEEQGATLAGKDTPLIRAGRTGGKQDNRQ
ncbi:MscS family membrane protein [Anseongella ginsenosidimutans]|uniref:MscS family membrane protein n=1 Tax=Anseongella ginsenosidimutans TaxID=496056 RepID=A0A4R3KU49_9SPHI|nr:mechanosensitive ion channel family protein [Anseongella ginsenosidimutans]QEC51572.1 mechanosensitive ion channel family protein [Anseongella ginsenosidimutans]TCS88897.1 MscS family membrane protein [Anseongella ginsenosidimutans]